MNTKLENLVKAADLLIRIVIVSSVLVYLIDLSRVEKGLTMEVIIILYIASIVIVGINNFVKSVKK